MKLKFSAIVAAAFILAACSSTPEESGETTGSGAAAEPPMTQQEQQPEVATGPLPGSAEDLTANVGDRVFFDFDKSNLKPEARATIERWAAWLKTYQNLAVAIEGHADERGTREYNLALGERRANSAVEYLVSLGVEPGRVKTISYGKERPAVTGSNENAWAQNRRGVLVLAN